MKYKDTDQNMLEEAYDSMQSPVTEADLTVESALILEELGQVFGPEVGTMIWKFAKKVAPCGKNSECMLKFNPEAETILQKIEKEVPNVAVSKQLGQYVGMAPSAKILQLYNIFSERR